MSGYDELRRRSVINWGEPQRITERLEVAGYVGGNVTDADRATALRLRVGFMEAETPEEADAMEDAIAAVLAAERAKALAPLLALADELEAWRRENLTAGTYERSRAFDYVTGRIRAAADPDQRNPE